MLFLIIRWLIKLQKQKYKTVCRATGKSFLYLIKIQDQGAVKGVIYLVGLVAETDELALQVDLVHGDAPAG